MIEEQKQLFNRIECMLFVAGDPVPVTEIVTFAVSGVLGARFKRDLGV